MEPSLSDVSSIFFLSGISGGSLLTLVTLLFLLIIGVLHWKNGHIPLGASLILWSLVFLHFVVVVAGVVAGSCFQWIIDGEVLQDGLSLSSFNSNYAVSNTPFCRMYTNFFQTTSSLGIVATSLFFGIILVIAWSVITAIQLPVASHIKTSISTKENILSGSGKMPFAPIGRGILKVSGYAILSFVLTVGFVFLANFIRHGTETDCGNFGCMFDFPLFSAPVTWILMMITIHTCVLAVKKPSMMHKVLALGSGCILLLLLAVVTFIH